MKAAIINQYGNRNELLVVDDYVNSTITNDQVLIKTYATSVNPI